MLIISFRNTQFIIDPILLKKNKYIIDELGEFSLIMKIGNNGLLFLINNFDNIKFENLEGVKEINLKFVKNNISKKYLMINGWYWSNRVLEISKFSRRKSKYLQISGK